jgi:hypothetical protein
MSIHITNPALLPKVRSRTILDAIAGMPCALRVSSFYPGYRCAHADTVVGCHLPVAGKSMGSKVSDLSVAAGCKHCHDIIDRRDTMRVRYIEEKYPTAFAMRLLEGLHETQSRWYGLGLIQIKGDKGA